jgi:hypothetical protein
MTTRRLKTYTGAEGRVYRYYFVGSRPAATNAPAHPATEYVFDASTDGASFTPVSIFLPIAVPAAWTVAHSRDLSDAERYAAVKLRLFRAFDESSDLAKHNPQLILDATAFDEFLAQLDLD